MWRNSTTLSSLVSTINVTGSSPRLVLDQISSRFLGKLLKFWFFFLIFTFFVLLLADGGDFRIGYVLGSGMVVELARFCCSCAGTMMNLELFVVLLRMKMLDKLVIKKEKSIEEWRFRLCLETITIFSFYVSFHFKSIFVFIIKSYCYIERLVQYMSMI